MLPLLSFSTSLRHMQLLISASKGCPFCSNRLHRLRKGQLHNLSDQLMRLCSAFFECADNKGIFEWNTVTNTFVKFFANITGYVSVAPGDDEVLVVGYDSNVNVLKPQSKP